MKCYRIGCGGTGVAKEIEGYNNGHECGKCGATWAFAPAPIPKPEPAAQLATSREPTDRERIIMETVRNSRSLKW